MKKTLSAVTLGLSSFFYSLHALAITAGEIVNPDIGGGGSLTHVSDWVNLLLTAVRWVYTVIFIIAVLFILLAAYNFITSSGDEGKTKTAKNQLLYAGIGIGVALLSWVIVSLIQNSLATGLS